MTPRPSRSLLVAAVAAAVIAVPSLSGAARAADAGTHPMTYRVTELASLGGQYSGGASINDRGWVSGLSAQPGDETVHAALWRAGSLTDLGTLGGPNSAVAWPVKSAQLVVGVSETAAVNPDGENWSCSAFFLGDPTHHNCVGFVWENGHLRALPTLGGPNGFAAGANEHRDVVGWAENGVPDPTCIAPQVQQFRAVRWERGPHGYRAHELAPLGADSTSAATAINDRGEVVGISGDCANSVGGFSAAHAVRWDRNGSPHSLGTLGGAAWNTPTAINDRGEITGFANVPGGATPGSFYPHAFLWTPRSGMRDLGTLPGDVLSQGLGINSSGQVVGESCQAHLADCRAFVWDGRRMIDLNAAATGGSVRSVHLAVANDINDAGQVTGQATDGGSVVAFVATPRPARDR